MKRYILLLIVSLSTFITNAQCTMKNTAFGAGEQIQYNLYFNWQFIWYKVGKATMSIKDAKYNGQQAYQCRLLSSSNGKLDKFFFMRDTLLSYITPQLQPLYYRKGAHEGKRYTVDEVWYSYPSGKKKIKMKRLNNDKSVLNNEEITDECVFDMISLFLRSRSFNYEGWKENDTKKYPLASGKGITTGLVKYKGKTKMKADNGKKYDCLKLDFSVWNSKKKKYERLATFFITDDKHHIPIRLDFNLRFGEAKAYLTSMTGTL